MFSPPPIILIGSHRSGTTWMGELLSSAPGTVYWVEPRPVWMSADPRRDDDEIPVERATPAAKNRIRREFARRVRRGGGGRLCEKTPSNCLRVPFVAEVFPEAKFIFVVRDGRSVLRSSDEMRGRAIDRDRLIARLREIPPWKWPRYVRPALDSLQAKFLGKKMAWWGPKPAGWRDMIDAPLGARLGWQWARTLGPAVDAFDAMPSERIFRWKCEDMMLDPRSNMQALVDFCELTGGADLVARAAREVDPNRRSKWRDELDSEILEASRPYMEPLMTRLGYGFDA